MFLFRISVQSLSLLQVYLNNKIFDNLITDSVDSQGVSIYNGPPCKDNPCMNGGICVPKLNIAECHCHKQFTGHRCQEGKIQFKILATRERERERNVDRYDDVCLIFAFFLLLSESKVW